MRFGNRQSPVNRMTFGALKTRVSFSRINLKIQDAAVVRRFRDMTAAARSDTDFLRLKIERVHRRYVVAMRAAKLGMTGKFVSERAGRISFAP